MLGCMCVEVFVSTCVVSFFSKSHVVFVCMVVHGSVPAPFGLYPKAVLQAHETSEKLSLGRLRDVSREHLSPLRIPQQS